MLSASSRDDKRKTRALCYYTCTVDWPFLHEHEDAYAFPHTAGAIGGRFRRQVLYYGTIIYDGTTVCVQLKVALIVNASMTGGCTVLVQALCSGLVHDRIGDARDTWICPTRSAVHRVPGSNHIKYRTNLERRL